MSDNQLVKKTLGISGLLQEPAMLENESEEDYRKRWAMSIHNMIALNANQTAIGLWVLEEEKLYLFLGFRSMRAYMASEMFPYSQGQGAKMLMTIRAYKNELGVERAAGLIGDVGIARAYAAASQGFDVREVDGKEEFIHSETGAVVTAEQLKSMGAKEASERLRTLAEKSRELEEELYAANAELEELRADLEAATGEREQELVRQLRKKEEELEGFRVKLLRDTQYEDAIQRSVSLLRQGVHGLDEMSGWDLPAKARRAAASAIGEGLMLLRKLERNFGFTDDEF